MSTQTERLRLATAVKRWPSREAREWTSQLLERLWADKGVLAVVCLGSAARGTSGSTDVDLAIVHSGPRPQLGRRPLDVDLRCFSSGEVERLLACGNDYLLAALRDGAPIFERNGYWRLLRERWRDTAPWPDPAESDRRAAAAERYSRALAEAGDRDAAHEQHRAMLAHRARSRLLQAGVFPASRPELVGQLEAIGAVELAAELRLAFAGADVSDGAGQHSA